VAKKKLMETVALIVMRKDGVQLAVHPSCVRAHERVGWVVDAVQPDPIDDAAEEPEELEDSTESQ